MTRTRTSALVALLASAAMACGEPKKDEPKVTTEAPSFRTTGFDEAASQLWGRGRSPYVELAPERVEPLRRLVADVSSAAASCHGPSGLGPLAAKAGFVVDRWEVGGQHYIALLESSETNPAAGAYVFRLGPTAGDTGELVIQAPHAFYDRGTGKIALQAFFALGGRARAFFTNTQHRHMQPDGAKEKRELNPADATQQPEHAFSVATAAALEALHGATVVQIHGFGRRTEIAGVPDAQAVISAGDRKGSTATSTAVADALRERSNLRVARFPEDTTSLGATKNAQLASMSQADRDRFVHVELSAETREQLLRDAAAATMFATALAALRRGEAP